MVLIDMNWPTFSCGSLGERKFFNDLAKRVDYHFSCVCKKDLLVFYYENYLFEFFGLRREESCLWKGSHAESFMSFVPKIVRTCVNL